MGILIQREIRMGKLRERGHDKEERKRKMVTLRKVDRW
jgi:hypothetical protein